MRLDLSEFQPKSMLHVPERKVPRSRYPVIDIHSHLSIRAKSVNGVGIGEKMEFLATPESILPVMDRKNIKIMVNLTGGSGKGLEKRYRDFSNRIRIAFLRSPNPRGTIPLSRITANFKPMKSNAPTTPEHVG